jgi:hypothetical protein
MTPKKKSECSAEESLLYLQDYFATVDLISEALSKYQILATDAQTASSRSFFRARALEADRDLELLKNQRRAFLREESAINPPTEDAVEEAEKRARDLAAILAKEKNSQIILDLASKGLAAFNEIHVA